MPLGCIKLIKSKSLGHANEVVDKDDLVISAAIRRLVKLFIKYSCYLRIASNNLAKLLRT